MEPAAPATASSSSLKDIPHSVESETQLDESQFKVDGTSDSAEVLDDEPRSILLALVSQLSIGMDLHRVTLPTFVLEPRSMCERISDFMSHSDLIISTALKQSPIHRFVDIVRYFLSGWHIRPKGVKKPFNPVLGEFFRCSWRLSDGSEAFYICEQISHHPPISTYAFFNPQNNFYATGDIHPKSKFLGNCAATIMQGSSRIRFTLSDQYECTPSPPPPPVTSSDTTSSQLQPPNDVYTITFPNIYARGILFGTMMMELGDKATITCENTNLSCTLNFKTRSMFNWGSSATGDEVSGTINHISNGSCIGNVNGSWVDCVYIDGIQGLKELSDPHEEVLDKLPEQISRSSSWLSGQKNVKRSGSMMSSLSKIFSTSSSGLADTPITDKKTLSKEPSMESLKNWSDKTVLFEVNRLKMSQKIVQPISQQEEFESRRLWSKVTDALQDRQIDLATAEKTIIEENQRSRIKQLGESEKIWKPRFFIPADDGGWKLDLKTPLPNDKQTLIELIRKRIFS